VISGSWFKRWTLVALCLVSLSFALAPAHAEPDYPKLTGRVVDGAGILTEETKAQLTASLAAEEKRSGAQIVVVTLKSLEGTPIETFGYKLGRLWQIGQKGKNNGVLFLVAPNEHRMRIEVGYGLEGQLTDLSCAVIIHDIVTPEFKGGDFDQGVLDGTNAILKVLGGGSVMDVPNGESVGAEAENFSWGVFFFILCGIVFIAWPALMIIWFYTHVKELAGLHGKTAHAYAGGRSSDSHSSVWGSSDHESSSSSSSDDDDFSGGGGDFGGGGASGSW
jgi:uncharacterized protein